VDYSTKAIDLVSLDFDEDTPRWKRIDLTGWDHGYFAAALRVSARCHLGEFMEDVTTVWIEKPFGSPRSTWALGLIAGAFLASLPDDTDEEGGIAVSEIGWMTWRQKLGVPRYLQKEAIQPYLMNQGFELPPDAPLDAWEALGIAVVARDDILSTIAALRPEGA